MAPRSDAWTARHRGPGRRDRGIVWTGVASGSPPIGLRRPPPPRTSSLMPRSPCWSAVSIIGVLLHVLMDLPTSYGTRLLSPFDWHWFAVDWMPIVDIYLLMVLVAGLVFGRASPAARRGKAAIVLTLMAANYGSARLRASSGARARARGVRPRWRHGAIPTSGAIGLIDSWPTSERRRRRRKADDASSRWRRCPPSGRRFSGASWRSSRTPTRSATSTCWRPLRPADVEVEAPWRPDAAISERLDADGPAGGGDAARPGLPRLLPLPGGAVGGRSAGRRPRCAGPTCALPARSCRRRPGGDALEPVHGRRAHRRERPGG